jgi:adenylosuccinate synthase
MMPAQPNHSPIASLSDAHAATTRSQRPGVCTAVVGLQWGDEGKGKIVDILAKEHDAVARYNGGANAGHSVVVAGTRYALHLIPSGILYPGKLAVIGNGVVIDPWKVVEELDGLTSKGVDVRGLVISDRAHVVLPYHKIEDGLREELLNARDKAAGEGESKIGTTRRGIGPAYADKCQRAGAVRMRDLLREETLRERLGLALQVKQATLGGLGLTPEQARSPDVQLEPLLARCLEVGERLRPMIQDTTQLLHATLAQGKSVLFEGANGTLLDVDHGTYPFVTGSSCVSSGIGTGTGVPASRLGRIVGVMKAYTTRVGGGPLPTELHDETGQRIRDRGREYGTTTGRPRRVGWLDLVALRYSVMINGVTGVALTMLDVLAGFDEVRACTAYEIDGQRVEHFVPDAIELSKATPVWTSFPGYQGDLSTCRSRRELPENARRYVEFLEQYLGVPADVVSVGPGREQSIFS